MNCAKRLHFILHTSLISTVLNIGVDLESKTGIRLGQDSYCCLTIENVGRPFKLFFYALPSGECNGLFLRQAEQVQ